MAWHGRLDLHYRRDGERTVAHDRHDGPLRVLQRLYPEGPRVCHHVLVHPPGGIVGGDTLDIDVDVDAGAHALITTPGATRFYRSAGEAAAQRARLRIDADARLEWLPLESIAFDGCLAENALRLELQPGAEAIGWDLVALGLPASQQPFARGRYTTHIEWPGVWLERGVIDATDRLLLQSPLGLAGHGVLATLWFASGSPIERARRDALLDAARERGDEAAVAGATSPDARLVVLRALSARVEPAMRRLVAVWSRWRAVAWQLDGGAPRVWRT
jgi:urease accessory protein